jgi:hypothetical protein
MSVMHRRYFSLKRERGYVADDIDIIIDSYISCIYDPSSSRRGSRLRVRAAQGDDM